MFVYNSHNTFRLEGFYLKSGMKNLVVIIVVIIIIRFT